MTNQRQPLQPPVESDDHIWDHIPETTEIPHFGPVNFQVTTISHRERMIVERMQAISFVGSPNTVRQQITDLSHHIEFDEIMAQTLIYDESKQHSSYELLKEILDTL